MGSMYFWMSSIIDNWARYTVFSPPAQKRAEPVCCRLQSRVDHRLEKFLVRKILVGRRSRRKRNTRAVDEDFIKDVKAKVATAAKALRAGTLNADPHPKKCAACDYLGMCTPGQQASATKS